MTCRLKLRENCWGGAIAGYSTHNVEQAIEATKLPIDYLAIGPIFATATKSDTAPCLVSKDCGQIRQAIGDFLVAIGGITCRTPAT